MLWISGDLTQRLRRRPEQDVVNDDLVLKGDGLDLLGHREYYVEVRHVEQFRPTVLQPLSACESLALWTAFVTAANGNFPVSWRMNTKRMADIISACRR
jgi:hypothetical protein